MNDKPDSIERRSRDTRPQPAWREPRRARPPFRDTRPQPAWRGGHPATPCKAALLAVLMAGLCPGLLRADGFFDPPPPSAERLAALDALCERLEALGMPAVPPDAEWVFLSEMDMWPSSETTRPDGHRRIPFFGGKQDCRTSGNAWRWRPATNGAACFLSVYGDAFPAAAQEEYGPSPARLARAEAGLRNALRDAAEGDETLVDRGPAVLFAAQLHRRGRSAQAAALLAELEGAGALPAAERSARADLGRAQFAELLRSPVRTNDLAASAAALEGTIARFPEAYSNISVHRVGHDPDPRVDLLRGARGRLAAEGEPVPGVPDDLQGLARALDRATETDGWLNACDPAIEDYDALLFENVPWLLVDAWARAIPAPASNAVWSVRALGPRAPDLLLPLLRDSTFVDGEWWSAGRRSAGLAYTRADAARCLLREMLPRPLFDALSAGPGDGRAEAALRALLADAGPDDLFALYLAVNPNGTPRDFCSGFSRGSGGLLLAWLADRAAEGPLPGIEARLEGVVRDVPLREWPAEAFDKEPGPQRALCLAAFYAAVRGEAAAPFRDRLLGVLRERAASWEPPSGRFPDRDALGLVDGTVELRYTDPDLTRRLGRAWHARWADALAAVPLGPSDPAALRARAAELAGWLRAAALLDADDRPLFHPGLDAVPPVPELLRALAAPFAFDDEEADREGSEDPFVRYDLGPVEITYRSGGDEDDETTRQQEK